MSKTTMLNSDFNKLNQDIAVVAGAVPGMRSFGKYGANFTPGTNDTTIWPFTDIGGQAMYPWMTAAMSLSAVSDSIEDDLGLTGAEYLYVEGVDALGVKQRAVIEMNGTTPVAIPGTWFRTDRCFIGECGSTGGNVGNITIYHTANAPANVVNGIPATFNGMGQNVGQSLNTFYTVRKGEAVYINYIDFTSVSSQTGVLGLRFRAPKLVADVRQPLTREGWRFAVPKAEAFGDQQLGVAQGLIFGEYTDIEVVVNLGTSAKASTFMSGRRAQVSDEIQANIQASLGTTTGIIP